MTAPSCKRKPDARAACMDARKFCKLQQCKLQKKQFVNYKNAVCKLHVEYHLKQWTRRLAHRQGPTRASHPCRLIGLPMEGAGQWRVSRLFYRGKSEEHAYTSRPVLRSGSLVFPRLETGSTSVMQPHRESSWQSILAKSLRFVMQMTF